jgi:quinol monooxygenase YgiN/catechol 2,3-dioxygenase-like lactoylglutathione lyase family enzyme
MMITVTAVQDVRPGMEAQLDELMRDLMDRVRENEPGCLRFDYVRADDDSNTRLVYEQYRDQLAFEHHKTTPYLHEFIPKLLRCLEKPPEVTTYGDVLLPAAQPPSYFHVGMVVPDLEEAVKRYTDVLGVQFTEPAVFDVPRLEDPYPHPFKLTAAFSMTEPPFYELIQAEGEGIVSLAHAGKILYYGIWEPDMGGRLAQLRAQGVGIDALFRTDAESDPFAIITAPDLFGARIEYVGTDASEDIEELVRTGRYAGGVVGS